MSLIRDMVYELIHSQRKLRLLELAKDILTYFVVSFAVKQILEIYCLQHLPEFAYTFLRSIAEVTVMGYISRDIDKKELVLGILRLCAVAVNLLLRRLNISVEIDFNNTKSSQDSGKQQDEVSAFDRFAYSSIDEEGRGYLKDLRSEWEKSELTINQIKIKELMFINDHCWGRFVSWLQLPRFLSLIKVIY
jgi:hypothetical protein